MVQADKQVLKTESEMSRPRLIGPLFATRQCKLPTWRAWLLGLLLLSVIGFVLVRCAHPFLAVNEPKRGGVLVVEGWASDYTLKAAAKEFSQGGYSMLYVVGGPIDRGAAVSGYDSFAELGAASLKKIGIPQEKIQAVPAPAVPQDRTYTEGRALRKWWEVKGGAAKTLHLFSEGAHARRSRLMFEMAFDNEVEVGVTAVPPLGYDGDHWWRTSAGFRTVTSEVLAYIYARIIFRP
jgi:uncharacterized SAM-binding protein YcdF (DUF218 family)